MPLEKKTNKQAKNPRNMEKPFWRELAVGSFAQHVSRPCMGAELWRPKWVCETEIGEPDIGVNEKQ